MKNLMILVKSFFLLRPRFLSTIFFIPILYGIGWVLSQPLLLFNFEEENLSLIGTIITFLIFIFLLPYWFYIKHNKSRGFVMVKIDDNCQMYFDDKSPSCFLEIKSIGSMNPS